MLNWICSFFFCNKKTLYIMMKKNIPLHLVDSNMDFLSRWFSNRDMCTTSGTSSSGSQGKLIWSVLLIYLI